MFADTSLASAGTGTNRVLLNNPLISKELIQASHQRWTYVARTGLPLLAIAILVPQLSVIFTVSGQDWRSLAGITRPIFYTCMWLQLIAFSLAASTYSISSVHSEWSDRTMEVLCATPLSRGKIVYGKFAAALSRLLLLAIAMLPIMGIWFHLGRIPREVVLGSLVVTLGSMFFFASVGLLSACASRSSSPLVTLLLPWYLAIILVDAFVCKGHPLLDALIPPYALGVIMHGSPANSWSVYQFSLLSLGLHLALGALALGLAPLFFTRTLKVHIGATRRMSIVRFVRRAFRGKRKPLKPGQNPLYWMEIGPPTRLLRWAFWLLCAVLVIILLAVAAEETFSRRSIPTFRRFVQSVCYILNDEEPWLIFFTVGIITTQLSSLFYGAAVFARERSRRTATALLLTGHRPRGFILPKILAVYRAQWLALCVLSAVGVGLFLDQFDWLDEGFWFGSLALAQTIILGPAAAVIIGVAFSVTARSPARATLGLLSTVVWAFLLGLVSGALFALTGTREPGAVCLMYLLLLGLFMAVMPRWSPPALGALLALTLSFWGMCVAMVGVATHGHDVTIIIFSNVSALLLIGGWYAVGARLFDRALSGQPARLWRHDAG